MKTEKEIRRRIAQINADDRYHYPPADVMINAPLALIQVDLKSEICALAWILGEKPPASRKGKRK